MIAEMNEPISTKVVLLPRLPSCQPNPIVLPPAVPALRGGHERIDHRIGECLDQVGKRQRHHQADRDDDHITAHKETPEPLEHDLTPSPIAPPQMGGWSLPALLLGDQLVLSTKIRSPVSSVTAHLRAGSASMILIDIHCVPSGIAEIFDHSATDLAVGPRTTHTRTFTATRLSRVSPAVPLTCFIRLFIRVTLGCARENSDAIRARPANAVRAYGP